MHRSDAYEFRASLSTETSENLKVFDECLFVVILDFDEPKSSTETIESIYAKNIGNRVHNKPISYIFFKSGYAAHHCNHTAIEGTFLVYLNNFIENLKISNTQKSWEQKPKEQKPSKSNETSAYNLEKIDFKLTPSQIVMLNASSKKYLSTYHSESSLTIVHKTSMNGKNKFRPLKIHPGVSWLILKVSMSCSRPLTKK